LLRAFPSLLNALGVDGNIAYIVFGVALLQALITAPSGIAGQLTDAGQRLFIKRNRKNVQADPAADPVETRKKQQ